MFKGLKEYIVESVKTYQYTIKIAGELDKNFLELFRYNLKKFDPISMSEPVTTPIQKSPLGFSDEVTNQPVTIFKVQFRYPATEPMIQQTAQLLGYNLNMVRVTTSGYDESIEKEATQYENEMEKSPVLLQQEMSDGGKDASKEYADQSMTSIKNQTKDSKIEMPFAGKKTPNAFDPFKAVPIAAKDTQSPMSKIVRPPKPKTGASA